ncbi:hypothetical protein K2X33_08555 [bacterium]|nr:hypothetical protein [bacterium]
MFFQVLISILVLSPAANASSPAHLKRIENRRSVESIGPADAGTVVTTPCQRALRDEGTVDHIYVLPPSATPTAFQSEFGTPGVMLRFKIDIPEDVASITAIKVRDRILPVHYFHGATYSSRLLQSFGVLDEKFDGALDLGFFPYDAFHWNRISKHGIYGYYRVTKRQPVVYEPSEGDSMDVVLFILDPKLVEVLKP